MNKVIHFVGPTPYSEMEKSLIKIGWRQEYLRQYNDRSTVRKLIPPTQSV